MNPWKLTDCLEPHEKPGDFPIETISSEEQLRRRLEHFRQRQPGLLVLESPRGDTLKIYLGGPYAGLRWNRNADLYRFALAEHVSSSEGIEFVEEGVENLLTPAELIPADQVVEAVVYFFNHHRLPESLAWKAWNPETESWAVVPARSRIPITNGPSFSAKTIVADPAD